MSQLLILHVISLLWAEAMRFLQCFLIVSLPSFLIFSFKKLFVRSCSHTHTPSSHRQRWKTCFSCFIPVRLSVIAIWSPVLFFLHFYLSFYFRGNEYPLHVGLRGKSGGDSSFYLDKLSGCVVPWAITKSLAGFYGGAHVLHGIYITGMTCGKPWIAQSTEAQQLNRTDNFSRWTCMCRQCI